MPLQFGDIYAPENFNADFAPIKEKIENYINLSHQAGNERSYSIPNNKLMRICLLVGLSTPGKRSVEMVESVKLHRGNRFVPSFFTHQELSPLYSALIKMRYHDTPLDLSNNNVLSRIISAEMYRGRDTLLADNNIENYLFSTCGRALLSKEIPVLNLHIGNYGDAEMEATLDINSRNITNSQIIIAGATGSGKTNLLTVLLQQIRSISVESSYPVNFLLFDYKGEFSDIQNNEWLMMFDVNRSAILNPIEEPLPFNPFKDLSGRTINEINLYSTEMASALGSLDRMSTSSNMSNRLSEAIVECYKNTNGAPITFEDMLAEYQNRMKDPEKDDSISSVLKQLVRAKIFGKEDKADLVRDSFIVKMDGYPKDGPIAKAIVFFLMSKLNNIYEQLEKQAINDDVVEIRHFSIIDEAHYMLSFDNRPLRNLIAVGRNKGLSVILATQNMSDFKSKYFDFYANAQYPLIMKQQTVDDKVIKDIFGVNGSDLQEIRSEIAGLQKGELIIKDQTAFALGMGKKYKKIKVTHLI